MALPFQNDPGLISNPNPYFQDNGFVRGDEMRATTNMVWSNDLYLDNTIAALQAALIAYQNMFIGSIAAFATSTPPSGWLECSGQTISRATYAALFARIGTTFGAGDGSTTFGLPELRGEFVRGWDDARGIDAGRAFGTTQLDALQGHIHDLSAIENLGAGGTGAQIYNGGSQPVPKHSTGPLDDSTHGPPRVDSETRPRNLALLYCIKY